MTPRRHDPPALRRLLLATLLPAVLTAIGPHRAHAAWPETGGAPGGGTDGVCADGRGGLFAASGSFLNRLDRNADPGWPSVGVGFPIMVLVADGRAGAWCAGIQSGNLFAQHVDPDGTPTIAAGSTTIETGQIGPRIAGAVTPAGDLVVAYWRSDGLYVQRVSQTGTAEFAGAGVRVTTDGSAFTMQVHAASEGAIVVWSSSRASLPGPAGPNRILANRVNSSGTVLWGAEGSVVQAGAGNFATLHRSVYDGTSVFVCWMGVGEPARVRAQRLDANGVAQWATTATGLSVHDFPDSGLSVDPNPEIVSDGAGGCVIAWEDGRNYHKTDFTGLLRFETDFYGQWLDAGGAAAGAPNGSPFVSGVADQVGLQMVPAGAGGVWLAYHQILFDFDQAIGVVRIPPPGGGSNAGAGLYQWVTQSTFHEHVLAPDGAGGVVGSFAAPLSGTRSYHYGPNGDAFVPVFALADPDGGESLTSSHVFPLTWNSNLGGRVRLDYNLSHGARVTIDAEEPDDGAFSWSVPLLASSQVRVHLSLLDEPNVADSSAAPFSVCTTLGTPAAHSVAPVATPNSPRDLAAGDFDGDGDMDLAVCVSSGIAIKIGNGAGSFAAPAFYGTPSAANGVATGDFDDDGALDLAVAHLTGLSILRGNQSGGLPNGTFAAATAVTGFTGGADVLALDLNADGILDVVVSDSLANRISVALGNGAGGVANGTFAAPAQWGTGLNGFEPEQLAAGDFNADGAIDLAVTAIASDRVIVMLGTLAGSHPTGAFGAPTPYACGADPRGITTGDFDEDGVIDLAVARTAEAIGVAVLRGASSGGVGTGAFGAPAPVSGVVALAQDVAMGDFDEDGIADLVVSNLAGFVQFAFGNGASGVGNGTFASGAGLAASTQPLMLELSDFNGDLKPDLAVSNSGSFSVSVGLAGCAAGGTTIAVPAPAGAVVAYLGDIETLGWTRGANVQAVDVEMRRGSGPWKRIAQDLPANAFDWRVVPPDAAPAQVRVRDSGVPSRVGTSPGTFAICDVMAPVALEPIAAAGPRSPVSVDLNEDGILDLAYLSNNDLAVKLGLGAAGVGNGDFANTETVVDLGVALAFALDVVDLGYDGITDAVAATSSGLRIAPGLGAGGVGNGTFGAAVAHGPAVMLRDLVVADFDEDGILDVAGVGGTPLDSLYVYRGLGADGAPNGTFANPVRTFVGSSATRTVTHDFNEDGILDLAVTNQSVGSPAIAVLLGQGTGFRGNGTFDVPLAVTTSTPTGLAVADVDIDGIADLVNWSEAAVSWNRGLGASGVGNGTFAARATLAGGALIRDVEIADVTRDGIVDLIVSRSGPPHGLDVYPGRTPGAPAFEEALVATMTQTPADLRLTDQDEDDVVDAIVCHDSADLRNWAGECSEVAGAVTLTTSLVGQSFSPFSEKTIVWTRSPDVTHVDVEYSRDGANWRPIARDLTETQFRWTVPPPAGTARLRVVDANVPSRVASGGTFTIVPGTVDAVTAAPVVLAFGMPQPNPSSGRVRFGLDLPAAGEASVELYDIGGRLVRTLLAGRLDAGRHAVAWDGRDEQGRDVAASVLFARARIGAQRFVRTVVRVR